MDRRTENHRSPSPLVLGTVRPVLLATTLLVSSIVLTQATGCKAARERRAQRQAERQTEQLNPQAMDASDSKVLPNATTAVQSGETQAQWLARQRIAQNDSQRGSAQETEPSVQSTATPSSDRPSTDLPVEREEPTGMTIVDDRPSARTNNSRGQSDDPSIEIIEPESRKVFDKRSKEEVSFANAVELHASGDLVSALRELERAIAFNPQFTIAFLESGDIYLEMAEYELAERQFALAVRSKPRSFMAQYRHGQVLHRLGKLVQANRAYLRALSIRPGDFDANLGISIVLLELGRVEQSMPYGQRAVKSDPPSGRARMHLGNVYSALDRHEEAITEYQQAGELMDAPSAGLLLNMAESLNTLGRYAEMVGALDQLVKIEPDAIAYERLGSGLFRLKRYEDSLIAFGKSSEFDSSHYPAFNGVAVCELNAYLWSSKTDAGARKRAVDAMRQSLLLERQQPRIIELLRRYSKPGSKEK